MDELHEELDEGGVSRRDALKKIGVTAAGFWAVPVISSFTARAYASHQSPVCSGHTFTCGGEIVECGTGVSGLCFCVVDVNGDEVCVDDVFCNTLDPCSVSGACPDGFRCIDNTCCSDDPICVPECGTGLRLASASVEGGLRPSGR